MKIISTLLLASVFSTSAFAWGEGKIGITVSGNKDLQVMVDGRAYQSNDNFIMLNDVQPGNHTIAVYRNNGNNRYDQSRGRNARNQNGNLVYSQNIYLKPNYYVDIMVNRFGKAMVDERALNDRDMGDWGASGNQYPNGGYGNQYPNKGGYGNSMSDVDFDQFLSRLRSQYNNGQRYTMARDGMTNSTFRVSQIAGLLSLFSSEPDKLELAKLAYSRVVDQQNFSQLYDQFSYRGRSDLDNFCRNGR